MTEVLLEGVGSTEAAVVADLAERAADPALLIPGSIVAFASERNVEDLERFLPSPRRKRGHVSLDDHVSLMRYIGAHAEATELYGDWRAAKIIAVLNGHMPQDPEMPGWGDHRATLTLRPTDEWDRWTGKNGVQLAQRAFAEHIEDGIAEITEPTGADMLELAQTFNATQGVVFKSHARLSNGETQFQYEETVEAKAGARGQLSIPERITLGIAPWEGTPKYKVTARLRYWIGGGQLKLWYQLDDPNGVLRSAFGDLATDIEEETSLRVLSGRPPTGV